MSIIGERIRSLRVESGLSQQELSDKLGIGRSTLANYEQGKREPDLETIEYIADYFNVDMNYLLGKSPIKNSYSNTVYSNRIKKRLKDLNLTIDDLCEQINIEKKFLVSSMQNSTFYCTPSNIMDLSFILQTEPEYLTGFCDNVDGYEIEKTNSKQEQTLKVIRRASEKMDDDKLDKMVNILKAVFPEEMNDNR